MSKLTKREIQLHDQAVCLLQKEHLSHEDKLFIFENFREDAEHINSKSGAFFYSFWTCQRFYSPDSVPIRKDDQNYRPVCWNRRTELCGTAGMQ